MPLVTFTSSAAMAAEATSIAAKRRMLLYKALFIFALLCE
jgi:hypothetical protein